MMASLPRPKPKLSSPSPSTLDSLSHEQTATSRRAPPPPPPILPSSAQKQSYLPGWPASNERGGGGAYSRAEEEEEEGGESSLRASFNSPSDAAPQPLPLSNPSLHIQKSEKQHEREDAEAPPNHHPLLPQEGSSIQASSSPVFCPSQPPPLVEPSLTSPWMAPAPSSSSSAVHQRAPQPYYDNSNIPRPSSSSSYYPPPPPHRSSSASAQREAPSSYSLLPPPLPHRSFSAYPPPPPPLSSAAAATSSHAHPHQHPQQQQQHHHQLAPSNHQPWNSAAVHQPYASSSSSSSSQPHHPSSKPYTTNNSNLLPSLPQRSHAANGQQHPQRPQHAPPPSKSSSKPKPAKPAADLIVGVVVPEYRMLGNVRMLVGKGGRLFDPNPAAAGVGGVEKDFECCFCDKVYKGKHARSIWRRHLCDKHGIPLSDQPRRTRWDKNEGRPKTDEERRERSLESKRKWASKKRALKKAGRSGSDEDVIQEEEEEEADDHDDNSSNGTGGGGGGPSNEPVVLEGTKGKRKAPAKAAGRAPPKKKVVVAPPKTNKGKGKEKVVPAPAPAPIRASGSSSSLSRSKGSREPAGYEEVDQQRRGQEEEGYESDDRGDDSTTTTAPTFKQTYYPAPPNHRETQNQQVFAQLSYDAPQPRDLPQYTSYPPNHYPTPTTLPASYQPSTHYPPPPTVPARFDVPRRPLSAFGSTSPHKARPQMTMPGFSPQRRSSFPSRGRDEAPLVGGVEDDGAAALLMALRANGSSPVKPMALEYEAESEEDEDEDASPPKEVWTSEMDAGIARYETASTMRVKEEDRSSPMNYEESATFDYSRTFKEEGDDYNEEEEREMERRKLERHALFPVVPRSLSGMSSSGHRSRQSSLVGPLKPSPSSSTIEPIPITRSRLPSSSALSPSAPIPLSPSHGGGNVESSPAFASNRTNEDFLQSSPPSPGILGRSPPANAGLLSSPVEHLSNDASMSRFTQARSKPPLMGTPTPSTRMMGGSGVGSSSSSRPPIPGLRWGEDVKRSMEVAYEGKGRGRALRFGAGGGGATGSGTPSRLWGGGASSSSSSRHVQDRRDDGRRRGSDEEDEDDEEEETKPFDSQNLVASSPSSSPVDGQTSTSSRRDSPLVPLFIPPQIPHRRPSSTPLTSLVSGSSTSSSSTLLPIFHPTPFKPSIPLGMTSIQSYTSNISSTRTPFKSSSSGAHPSSTPSNNSTLLNSTNGVPSSQASQQRYAHSSSYTTGGGGPTSSTRTIHLGSSPPASSFFQLSSPQSLSLTRSLGLAPATPGNGIGGGMWGVATTPDGNGGGGGGGVDGSGGGRKRKGSWSVSGSASGGGEGGKRLKGERGRDSGFFEESEEVKKVE